MPPRDPRKSQLDFPELIADLIRELQLLGAPIGLLDFNPTVQPVYIVSARGGSLQVEASEPVIETAEIFSDVTNSPAVNAVLADTGQLIAGDYDVKAICSWASIIGAAAGPLFDFQHRNAANAVTLSRIPFSAVTESTANTGVMVVTYAARVAANERLRWQALLAVAPGEVSTVVMAARRVNP